MWGGCGNEGVARCLCLEEEMYGCKYAGNGKIVRLKEFGNIHSSEVQMYCIDSNESSTTVCSRGGVLFREGLFSEVPLYYLFLFLISFLPFYNTRS